MVAIMYRKKIFLNALYLFVGNVLVRFVSALATILVAQHLGAEEYGLLGVAIAIATVAGYFTDLGLTHTLIREATKPKADIKELMSSFIRIRFVLAGFITIFSLFLIQHLYSDSYFRYVIYWVVVPTIWGAALQGVGAVYFQVIQQMQYTALIRAFSGFITAGTLFLGIFFYWPLTYLAPVYGLSSILGGCVSLLLVLSRLGWLRGWNPYILKGLGSFTVGSFIVMLLPQLGPLLLERVTDLKQVGYFVAAYRIPSVLYQVPGTIAAAFYPVLFEYGNRRLYEEHHKLVKLELKVMSMIGVAMALPFLTYPEWWIGLLFGKEWMEAAPVFQLLAVIVILQSVNYPLADALTTLGWQKYRTIVLTIALVTSVFLYLVAGARWGAMGGAIVAIAIECILLIGFITFVPSGCYLLFTGTWRNVVVLFFVLGFVCYLKRYDIYSMLTMILIDFLYVSVLILLDRFLRVYLIRQLSRIRSLRGVKRSL